jgi:hypothetical protein
MQKEIEKEEGNSIKLNNIQSNNYTNGTNRLNSTYKKIK